MSSSGAYSGDGSPLSGRRVALEELAAAEDAILLEMLSSSEPTEIAWAAYIVGQTKRGALAADLVGALGRVDHVRLDRDDAGDETARRLTRVLLAAAADAGFVLPMELLRRYLRGPWDFRGPATIILLRGPMEDLLTAWDMFGQGVASAEQIAIGNHLAATRTLAFCSRLLGSLKLQLHVVATDEREGEEEYAPYWARVAADFYIERGQGFPPLVHHFVSRDVTDGAAVLAKGLVNVFTERRETSEEVMGSSAMDLTDPDRVRQGLIATLLDVAVEELGLPMQMKLYVASSRHDEFTEAVRRAQRRYEARYWAVVASAIEKGVLTKKEAAELTVGLATSLEDERTISDNALTLPVFESTSPYR